MNALGYACVDTGLLNDEGICMNQLELKVPPVAVILLAGLLMWLVSAAVPLLAWPFPYRHLLALALVVVGLGIGVTGVVSFRSSGTTVNPTRPQAASALVTGGVHRFTRNPMYLGLLLILIGWGAFLANVLAFAVLPLFVMYMNRFQIIPEERALLARFGEEFAAYQQRVRRWV